MLALSSTARSLLGYMMTDGYKVTTQGADMAHLEHTWKIYFMTLLMLVKLQFDYRFVVKM